MPQIRINEDEVVSSSALDITDNVVFVPVFTKSEELGGKFKLYSNFSDFSKDFENSAVKYFYVKDGETIERSNDRSYVYAYECLLNGLKVLAYGVYTASDFTDTTTTVEGQSVTSPAELAATTAMNTALTGDASPLTSLQDKNLYNIKFITSGGYQSPQSVMITAASTRGDCLALLDLAEDTSVSDLLESSSTTVEGSKFASCFFPWCTFNFSTEVTGPEQTSSTTLDYKLPGSLAYLLAYGRSVQSNANWFAASGVTRGTVPSLVAPVEEITEAQMHKLQGDEGSLNFYVNPIMMVGSYGYKVWGNRTTLVNSSVDSYFKYLNIRMLLCDIKKTLYEASIRSTFEPNDDVTWINFKSMCSGLLDRMTSGRGLNWYRWRRVPAKKKATIEAILTISPIEAVENFDLTVMLTDQDVTVTETL